MARVLVDLDDEPRLGHWKSTSSPPAGIGERDPLVDLRVGDARGRGRSRAGGARAWCGSATRGRGGAADDRGDGRCAQLPFQTQQRPLELCRRDQPLRLGAWIAYSSAEGRRTAARSMIVRARAVTGISRRTSRSSVLERPRPVKRDRLDRIAAPAQRGDVDPGRSRLADPPEGAGRAVGERPRRRRRVPPPSSAPRGWRGDGRRRRRPDGPRRAGLAAVAIRSSTA